MMGEGMTLAAIRRIIELELEISLAAPRTRRVARPPAAAEASR